MKKSIGIILIAAMLLSSFAVFAHADTGERITESGIYVAELADNVKISGAEKKIDNRFESITAQNVTYADSALTEGGDHVFYADAEVLNLNFGNTEYNSQYLLIVQNETGAPTEDNICYIDQRAGASKLMKNERFDVIISMSGNSTEEDSTVLGYTLLLQYDNEYLEPDYVDFYGENSSSKANLEYAENIISANWGSDSGYKLRKGNSAPIETEGNLFTVSFIVKEDTDINTVMKSFAIVDSAADSQFGKEEESKMTAKNASLLTFSDWNDSTAEGIQLSISAKAADDSIDFRIYPTEWQNGTYYVYLSSTGGDRMLAATLNWFVPYKLGDADNNGIVDISDVVTTLRHVAHIDLLNSTGEKAADVNRSGSVDISDVVEILRYVAHIIGDFE